MNKKQSHNNGKCDTTEDISLEKLETMVLPSYVQTMKEYAIECYNTPPAEELLSDLIYSQELTILAAKDGQGKSVVANHFAFCWASGANEILGYDVEIPKPRRVLLIDIELRHHHSRNRVPNPEIYPEDYPEGFVRLKIDTMLDDINKRNEAENEGKPKVTSLNIDNVIDVAMIVKPDILIIDNISVLIDNLHDSKEIKTVLDKIKDFIKETKTTVVVIAHLSKDYGRATYLSSDHVFGASVIKNTVDSVILIGSSAIDDDLKFIKQTKIRNGKSKHGQVTLYQLEKNQHGMLIPVYKGKDREDNHVKNKVIGNLDDNNLKENVQKLFTIPGEEIPRIELVRKMKELGIVNSEQTGHRRVSKLIDANLIIQHPSNKKYMLNQNELDEVA